MKKISKKKINNEYVIKIGEIKTIYDSLNLAKEYEITFNDTLKKEYGLVSGVFLRDYKICNMIQTRAMILSEFSKESQSYGLTSLVIEKYDPIEQIFSKRNIIEYLINDLGMDFKNSKSSDCSLIVPRFKISVAVDFLESYSYDCAQQIITDPLWKNLSEYFKKNPPLSKEDEDFKYFEKISDKFFKGK